MGGGRWASWSRDDFHGGESSRRAHDAAAGVSAGAALPVAFDRRAGLCRLRRRSQEEELVWGELALEDVPLGETGDPLDVGGRQHLTVQDQRFDVRRVARHGLHHRVAERLALRVVPAPRHVVRRVLYENAHDMVAGRRHPRFDIWGDADVLYTLARE